MLARRAAEALMVVRCAKWYSIWQICVSSVPFDTNVLAVLYVQYAAVMDGTSVALATGEKLMARRNDMLNLVVEGLIVVCVWGAPPCCARAS